MGCCKRPSHDKLYDLYCTQSKTTKEISQTYEVSSRTVSKWLAYHKIPSWFKAIRRPDKETLHRWYWDEKKTMPEIAKICGCSYPTIRNWFKKFNISRRSHSDAQTLARGTDHVTKEFLTKLYVSDQLSQSEIGARLGITQSAVKDKMHRFNIPARGHVNAGAKNGMYGRHHTAEACAKIREANRRQFSTQEARERHAILTAKQIAAGKTGKTHNKLETLFASILDDLDIEYTWQYRLGRYCYDFYLPETNTIIEINGTFWHSDPRFYFHGNLSEIQQRNVMNDKRKAKLARQLGYRFLFFWEHDIHNAPDKVRALLA